MNPIILTAVQFLQAFGIYDMILTAIAALLGFLVLFAFLRYFFGR